MPSAWNLFVKKVYHEGKAKNSNYDFKTALKDASRRKHEMGHSKTKGGARRSRHASMAGGRKTRRRRHRR